MSVFLQCNLVKDYKTQLNYLRNKFQQSTHSGLWAINHRIRNSLGQLCVFFIYNVCIFHNYILFKMLHLVVRMYLRKWAFESWVKSSCLTAEKSETSIPTQICEFKLQFHQCFSGIDANANKMSFQNLFTVQLRNFHLTFNWK